MKNVLAFLCFCLLISCGKDEEIIDESRPSCLGDVPTAFGNCSGNHTVAYCDVVELDKQFVIPDNILQWLPNNCDGAGAVQIYSTVDDRLQEFTLNNKSHNTQHLVFPSDEFCSDTEDGVLAYCAETELLSLQYTSDLFSSTFSLSVSTSYIPPFTSSSEPDRQISIATYSPTYVRHFVLSQSVFFNSGEVTFDEIEIAGRNFTDVRSYVNPLTEGDHVQFFYTMEKGIVGFIDQAGDEWALVQ